MVCGCRLKKGSICMNCSLSVRLQSSSNFLNMWLSDLSNLINVRLRKLLGFLDQHNQINEYQQLNMDYYNQHTTALEVVNGTVYILETESAAITW